LRFKIPAVKSQATIFIDSKQAVPLELAPTLGDSSHYATFYTDLQKLKDEAYISGIEEFVVLI